MMISVHLPKTAGTSFRGSLETHFGRSFLSDYSDIPINRTPWKRNSKAMVDAVSNAFHDFSGIECIHGHFMPMKYLVLSFRRPLTFITWLRNPVDRLISHYHFWKTNSPPVVPPLHARMLKEGWTLERFCLGKEMRDIYHQFLWGFPIKRLNFIGITEFYQEDFGWFAKNYLMSETPVLLLNKNSQSDPPALSTSLRKAIEVYHEKDIALYSKAMELRWQRLKGL
jgi:hypothetical protein